MGREKHGLGEKLRAGLLDLEGFSNFLCCDATGENQLGKVSENFEKLGLTYDKAELLELMHTADADNTGSISFEEFQSLFDAANLRKVFDQIDSDRSGSITESELLEALVSMHIHVTRTDVKKMVAKVDQNSDGLVTFGNSLKYLVMYQTQL